MEPHTQRRVVRGALEQQGYHIDWKAGSFAVAPAHTAWPGNRGVSSCPCETSGSMMGGMGRKVQRGLTLPPAALVGTRALQSEL